MKKISFLLMLMFAFFGLNAQTVVLTEDFSAITDSGSTTITNSLDQYTQVPGWVGDWVYPSYGKVKLGKATNGQGFIQTPAIDLSANNGQFVVSFDAKAWNNDATSMIVAVNDVPYTVDGLSTTTFNSFSLPLSGGTSSTIIKFQGKQANHARIFLDNIVITSQELGPDTDAPFIVTGSANTPNTVVLRFNENLDNATAVNTANYVFEGGNTVSSASVYESFVTLTATSNFTNGVPFELYVQNVADIAGNVMEPDTITLTYGVLDDYVCADIATLRSKFDYTLSRTDTNWKDNVEYMVQGSVVVVATDSYENQKILQDESGAILVYDHNNVLGTLETCDKISGIYGTLTNYYGFLELVPTRPYEQYVDYVQPDAPMTVTLEQLNDNSFMVQHQAKLIKLENVTITSSGNFAKFNRYDLSQSNVTAPALYPYFQDANYLAMQIPTGIVQDITGFNFATSKIGSNSNLDFRYYIVPRSTADMTAMGNKVQDYGKMKISVYPNPTVNVVTIGETEATDVEIYDINGKKVATQSMQNTNIVSLHGMSAGSYFLRLLKDGELVGTAKVIKR